MLLELPQTSSKILLARIPKKGGWRLILPDTSAIGWIAVQLLLTNQYQGDEEVKASASFPEQSLLYRSFPGSELPEEQKSLDWLKS